MTMMVHETTGPIVSIDDDAFRRVLSAALDSLSKLKQHDHLTDVEQRALDGIFKIQAKYREMI